MVVGLLGICVAALAIAGGVSAGGGLPYVLSGAVLSGLALGCSAVAGRLLGDRLTARFGPVAFVRARAAVSVVGLGASLAVAHPVGALVGFGCAGLGFSIIFPLALSAAGRAKGMSTGPAIAAVATAGYFGFLVGPPSIGFVAEALGLGVSLYIVVALSAAIVVLAGSVGRGYVKDRCT